MSNPTRPIADCIDVASKHCGGFSALAKLLSVAPSSPHMWKSRGVVPIEHCAAIEQACGGVVRRWHLRPSDWHRIWPELVGADGAPAIPTTQAAAAADQQENRHAA